MIERMNGRLWDRLFVMFLVFVLMANFAAEGQEYNFYYGTLHAHSGYSDGNKDSLESGIYKPYDDFLYARESQNFDFLGISEHNHLAAGLVLPNYHLGLQEANLANLDGEFVCLFGMEWGVINSGGHLIVYGFDSLVGWDPGNYDIYNAETDYQGLFEKIAQRNQTFAYLAHPQSTDYDSLFFKPYDSIIDKAITAIPFRSGPAFSTSVNYDDPANGTYLSKFQTALSKGYHVGICMDHDTHNTVFGRSQAGRTGVITRELTQGSILNAYHEMNIFASDDWNAQVDFRINNKIMGSVFSGQGQPEVTVNYLDPDGEGITQMWLYDGTPGSGLPPNLVYTIYQNQSFSFTPNLNDGETKYYYVKVQQTDGDQMYTSPIWYTRDDDLGEKETNNLPVLQVKSGITGDWVNINLHSNGNFNGELKLVNQNGQQVFSEILPSTGIYSKNFTRQMLGSGLFVVYLSSAEGVTISRKFVME